MENAWKNGSSWLLVACALLIQLVIAQAGNVVPVMLWCGESSSILVNPLHKTVRPEFEGILAERLGKGQPPMIVFVKDNFCVEDIKHHKESLQQLNNVGSLTYLTSVESAVTVFENLPSYNVTMEDDLESVVEGQLALVQVNDLNAIPEIYNMVRESSPNLIVALTGKSCGYTSLERVKRETVSENNATNIIVNPDKKILFSANKISLMLNKGEYVPLKYSQTATINVDNTEYNLTMTFKGFENSKPDKISLTAHFNKTYGYFSFLGIQYVPDGDTKQAVYLKSRGDIAIPVNYSYHCSTERLFSAKVKKDKEGYEDYYIKITNLQVQMDTDKFGDAYDCVGFMSIPIWTGIFVTAILALIMIWGLTMIMDIRTMDRFDDPKGKTITISAQE